MNPGAREKRSLLLLQSAETLHDDAAPRQRTSVITTRSRSVMRRLIVAITGASGVIYGIRTLEVLRDIGDIETHLILTPSGARTLIEETDYTVERVRKLADQQYNYKDIGASISSGSYKTEGMLVAPCSVKSLAASRTATTMNSWCAPRMSA